MLTYEQLKEKCTCWKGYKRKPGTKPCAEGSCVKEEVSSEEKHHAMVFGRMNPITTGHEAVVNKLHSVAAKHHASHSLVVSHSQDAKKNPLTGEQKVEHAKHAFPDTNVSASSKDKPTILHHAAELHKNGVTHLHVVAGSDRHEAMHELLHKYNGQQAAHGHYNFKKITVHSSGERDPDSEGTEGMSASKMREHAAAGNKKEFHKGAPSTMSSEHKDKMYHDVRKGMNIKESLEEAHKLGDKVIIHKGPISVIGKTGHIGEIRTAISGNKTYTIDHEGGSIQLNPSHFKSVKEETTPYWKKPSFNKRMSKMAKQERLERERKETEKKPVKEHIEKVAGGYEVESEHGNKNLGKSTSLAGAKKRLKQVEYFKHMKEETKEQQADRAAQLKRFKDQMSKSNGPQIDTEIALDKKEKAAMGVKEHLDAKAGAGAWINDFISSTNPRFNNKSKAERRKMAIGAYMAAKAKGGMKEEAQLDELSTDLLARYKTASHANAKASDEAGNYSKGDKRFAGINKATRKQFDNDLKKHGQYVKEGRGLADKYWSIAQDRKETADENKGNHETYHTHMADYHDHMSRYHEELGQHSHAQVHADKADIHYEKSMQKPKTVKEGTMQDNGTDKIDAQTSAPTASTAKNETPGKKVKGFKFFSGENQPNTQMAVKEETLDEKSEQAKRNKTMKNMMDASRGARFKVQNKLTGDAVRDWDNKHPTARAQNVAIGRALRNEEAIDETMTGNPHQGYHGAQQSADDKYEATHKHVKNLTDADDKTVKHYLDSSHGRHLAGREDDHEYIKKDFKKFKKYYRPEMHEETAPLGKVQKIEKKTELVKLHPNGVASDTEEGWAKPKIKEESMKSYKEFLQGLDEASKKKPDWLLAAELKAEKKEGKLKEEAEEQINEYEADKNGVYRHTKKATYGTSYTDPAGADETAADMKKKEKAGRKTGQSTGSYKPRKTMSKLKQLGATYK